MINAAQTAIPNWFVVVMGMGTVFVGLICIVLILKLISWVVNKAEKPAKAAVSAPSNGTAGPKKYEVSIDGAPYEVTLKDGAGNNGNDGDNNLEIILGE